MNKLIVSNWKMKPQSISEAADLLEHVNDSLESLGEGRELSLVFCPPFTHLDRVRTILSQSHLRHQAFLGAQDIAPADEGALTGEISGPMLVRLGVQYVIVGHSERRWKMGETSKTVNQKLKSVLRNGMTPIVCIGERSQKGDYQTEVARQIEETFEGVGREEVASCVVAYEPVWAISTESSAEPATPQGASQMAGYIASLFDQEIQCIYGGSVTSSNVENFLKARGFSGVLIGGASVQKEEFAKIVTIAVRSL